VVEVQGHGPHPSQKEEVTMESNLYIDDDGAFNLHVVDETNDTDQVIALVAETYFDACVEADQIIHKMCMQLV